ncbi:MAG TPA: hypothetical protein VGM33_01285 [Baekduia sp.]
MPDLPPADPAPRRRRAPGARSLIAGALASAVAIFGVLALRVHAGDDPALGQAKAATADTTTSSSSPAVDPYDAPATGDDGFGAPSDGDQSSAPAAAAPTTRAS